MQDERVQTPAEIELRARQMDRSLTEKEDL